MKSTNNHGFSAAALVAGLPDAKGKLMAKPLDDETVTFSVDSNTYTVLAWQELPAAKRQRIAEEIWRIIEKDIRNLSSKGRNLLDEFIMSVVAKELVTRKDEIESRIRAEVSAQWEAKVEKVVAEQLAVAVAKVKAELLR